MGTFRDIRKYYVRDWSLIKGRGATKREGKFYPYEKGGKKCFGHAEGGGAQQVLG